MSFEDFDDDELEDIKESTLFDVSDIKFDAQLARNGKSFTLVMRSQSEFNLMRCYLALSAKLVQMGHELGVYDPVPEPEDEH